MPKQRNYHTVFKNPVFEVGEFEVVFEDGTTKKYSKIVKQDSVVVVPVTNDSKIVFIREYHAAVDRTFLTLPGGRVDEGEQPKVAALRELEEETGYRAGEVKPLAELLMTPGYLQQTSYGYLATNLQESEQALEAGERIKVELLGFDEVDTLIAGKELIEARDVALCLMALKKVRER